MSNLRFGKRKARVDPRTIRLMDILKPLPPPPDSFSVDATLPLPIPLIMFGNDQWGDCVVAGRANATLRWELLEHGVVLPITTQQCLNEYWREQGWTPCPLSFFNFLRPKPDNGLVVLDSLNQWRQAGWIIPGEHADRIHAFASALQPQEIKWGCQYLYGVQIGVALPYSAVDQFNAGEPWTVLPDDGGVAGGHLMYSESYNPTGPIFCTWAKKQQATWEWLTRYMDESYVLVDEADSPSSPIDVEKLEEILQQITA